MENQQSDFVRARATFQDKTKGGDDKITLVLGQGDVASLVEKINAIGAAEGVKLTVFLKPFNGKTLGSLTVTDGSRKGDAAPAPKRAFAPKKTFGFTPKK
jgi:hypothetical protein